MNQKQIIRKTLLQKRNILPKEQQIEYSKLIRNRLFSLKQYQETETILIYASYLSEVSTYEIIKNALNTGKKVFCPKVLTQGIMEFFLISSLEDITAGYKNIPEPQITRASYQSMNHSDALAILPLVGFDSEKNRLGYGGGFYDRYLQRFPHMEKIALAFECQKCDSIIPTEETDLKPDFIITEQTIY